MDVQAELFPEVLHTRTVRRLKRQDFAFTRKMRREARQVEQSRYCVRTRWDRLSQN